MHRDFLSIFATAFLKLDSGSVGSAPQIVKNPKKHKPHVPTFEKGYQFTMRAAFAFAAVLVCFAGTFAAAKKYNTSGGPVSDMLNVHIVAHT
jgi:hypothetical protein